MDNNFHAAVLALSGSICIGRNRTALSTGNTANIFGAYALVNHITQNRQCTTSRQIPVILPEILGPSNRVSIRVADNIHFFAAVSLTQNPVNMIQIGTG